MANKKKYRMWKGKFKKKEKKRKKEKKKMNKCKNYLQ